MAELGLAALGLLILLLAGDALVRGAVNMALRLGVPALLVSLTVVAFGTSAPELLIAIQGVRDGVPGLALGNVVGSNIANILLVLGIPALISRMSAAGLDLRKSYVVMVVATLLFIAVSLVGTIGTASGIVLLVALAAILSWQARGALQARRASKAAPDEEEVEGADPEMRWWKIALYLVLGLIGLPLGADILIDSATTIAERVGVSDTLIGLTLVAVGTSLPELATSAVAAWKGKADVALGNVIGSNMFNLLAIIGIASLFGDIPADPEIMSFDVWIMLLTALILAPFVFVPRIWLGRRVGAVFCTAYALYIVALIARSGAI